MGKVFTFSCLPLTIQRSGPIISPGKPSSHTHTAKNGDDTTCGVEIDRSNYWISQLCHKTRDELFEKIEYENSVRYYFNRACNYSPNATSCDGTKYLLVPPAGLSMVAENLFLQFEPCLKLRSQVFLHSCWSENTRDSPDHQSHRIPRLEITTKAFALQNAMATCTGPGGLGDPECSITKVQKRAMTPIAFSLDVPPPIEELGRHGPIPNLPGDNPVKGPHKL
ncbi:hypothetical protein BDV23DRAFT_176400 [Aspergillus alliaceus]|uniref:DUF1996 domain-containing protein n=1 Tax=Petromyces alliaceus TaxID=209559 RepID=A0A5N7BU37_PETAA|nr:hypothetical protein BDV23DRAFT_176400 [Aspergillus alliaceus]